MAEAQRVANGQHHIANACGIGIAERNRLQVLELHLQDREVGGRIRANHHGICRAPVLQQNLDGIGFMDDVIVGQDVTLGGHDHTGAQ